MRKWEKLRYTTLGMLLAVIALQLILPAGAALAGKTIQVFTGVDIYVDDVKLDPRDAKGNPVEVFVYNGTTYLPIRAVGEAVGKTVQWDGKTNSAYLGKHTGEKPAVWLKDLDYFTGKNFSTLDSEKDNLGNTQTNVIYENSRENIYKLNGQYRLMTGTLFQRYNYRSDPSHYEGYIKVYGDGELLYEAKMNSGIEPIDFSVSLVGILELKVAYYSGFSRAGTAIANCGLWT